MPTTQEQFNNRHRQILVLQQNIQNNKQQLLKQQLQQQKRNDLEYEIKTYNERIHALKEMIKKLETKLKQTKTQQQINKMIDDVAIRFWVRELVNAERAKEKRQQQLGPLKKQQDELLTYYQHRQDVPQVIQIKQKIALNNQIIKDSTKKYQYANAKLLKHIPKQKIQQAKNQFKKSLNV